MKVRNKMSENLDTRPSINLESEDWRLSCFLDWAPKQHIETCPTCKGTGKVGGGLGDLDGPIQCEKCFGTRNITCGPKTPKPQIPAAIKEHMRRAWYDYFNTKL